MKREWISRANSIGSKTIRGFISAYAVDEDALQKAKHRVVMIPQFRRNESIIWLLVGK